MKCLSVDRARAFPDRTIILDHFGGPLGIGPYAGKADEVYAQWRTHVDELATCDHVDELATCDHVDELATCDHVVAKLAGTNMEVNGFGWHTKARPPSPERIDAIRPDYEHVIEKFGMERGMFESNFPVDKGSCSCTVPWSSFKRLTAGYTAAEKAKLFHDIAARVYRLDSQA